MGKLDNKVALVTGASRGIGQAIAELFAAEGAKVVCAARTINEGDHKLEGSLSNTVQRIIEGGGNAVPVAANISEEQDCRALFDAAISAFDKVDILVNNAALNYYVPIVDYDVSKWMRAFAVNVHGPFMLSKFVLPGMIDRNQGAIINISSGSAIPTPTIALSQISSDRIARRDSVSFLESPRPLIGLLGSRTTAAATTGPASGPRPASSMPAISFITDFACR